MTREEADKLQESLDQYVKLRDLNGKSKAALMMLTMGKMSLSQTVSGLLPKNTKIGGIDIDVGLLMGVAAAFLGKQLDKLPGFIPVVVGYEDVEKEDIGREEYERMYCILVPGDIMRDAMNLRSRESVFKIGAAKMKEMNEQKGKSS